VDTPVVGVVGAGQLARMMQEAAIGLGVPLRLLAESADDSAAQAVAATQVGDYRDLETLRAWAEGCAVVTFDHEHVPTGHLEKLMADGHACRPGPGALVHAQDKAVMRARLEDLGVPCPRNALVRSAGDVDAFAEALGGYPLVLKATRGGYDGRGSP
jgi:5-(carboxyamino)imidazole ribonucleotide synthase